MELPATPRRALASLLARRAQVRLRGLRFRERDASRARRPRPDPHRHLLVGRHRPGHRRHHSRGRFSGSQPAARLARRRALPHRPRARRRGLLLVDRRRPQRAPDGAPHRPRPGPGRAPRQALGARLGRHGQRHRRLRDGRWREARTACERAEAIFRERCTGAIWERDSVRCSRCGACRGWASWASCRAACRAASAHAEDRGDLYAATNLKTGPCCYHWLSRDDPGEARFQTQEALRRWSNQGFHLQHFLEPPGAGTGRPLRRPRRHRSPARAGALAGAVGVAAAARAAALPRGPAAARPRRPGGRQPRRRRGSRAAPAQRRARRRPHAREPA